MPDLAKESTEPAVKFEFQTNNKHFSSISMSHEIFELY